MKYDITKSTAPSMPSLGKGIECFKLLLSQTSNDMNAPLLPMLPPVLGTKISQAEFQYPSGQWFEMCGQKVHLVADSEAYHSASFGKYSALFEKYSASISQKSARFAGNPKNLWLRQKKKAGRDASSLCCVCMHCACVSRQSSLRLSLRRASSRAWA